MKLMLLGGIPPKEFRIFKKGWNETTKGRFLFDDEAARLVMKAYADQGIERMIDLEHLSLDDKSPSYDPDSRGWFKLAMRDGDLWAYDVRWTSDGERRLRNALQRYISPVFDYDENTMRIAKVFNAAIVAVPATHKTPALVAASARTVQGEGKSTAKRTAALSIEATNMEALKKILAALGLSEDASLEDALAAIKALQEPDGDEGALLKEMCKALGLADDATKEDVMKALADDEEKLADDDEEKKGELAALRSNVKELTKQVQSLSQRSQVSEVEKMIADNTDKIPLHMEAWAREQSPTSLRAFLKHAISVPREPKEEKKRDTENGKIELTAEEKKIAKLSGIKPEVVLKHKERMREKQKEAQDLQ